MRPLIAATAVALLAAAAGGVAAGATSGAGPRLAGCPVFPASNAWNRDVSHDPVDPRSDAYLRSIGIDGHLHPDFGSGRYGNYGIPITIASASQPRRAVHFTAYGDESDHGGYPIPRGRASRAAATGTCWSCSGARAGSTSSTARSAAAAAGRAASGAIFNLRSNRLRHAGWTSADAAGLPIMPGLARPDEARAGAIRHALRFTVARTQAAYVAPARHFASGDTNPDLPPMGLRLRLKASYDLRGYHGQSLAILRALRTYGMIVADNGSSWYISGAADRRWNDADIEQLKRRAGQRVRGRPQRPAGARMSGRRNARRRPRD